MSLIGPIISVEDDTDDQYLISQIIQSFELPNKLIFFPNGKMALHYLETTKEKPFLILCDINMPVMNGLELREHINKNEFLRRKSIPFIFLSTAANAQLIHIAYDAAVQGFYKKATSYSKFQQQLKLIIDYWQDCLHPNSQL
ncbi:response regulator [Runella slithyformis]|uniref:Response regulator receiver n=1 Tax=Runella slithyformis (strain ATCC 29530 / DSM 19594 / LMG 11500 / NCIMB 11436 / LSU 4) TaxID=761193 RepID=A0A7U3ZHV8_RUNSL|nr:response regulator [Runella slithyformis]AEI47470.1 response regulator receiver [Runella slithyformis DSM 19594]